MCFFLFLLCFFFLFACFPSSPFVYLPATVKATFDKWSFLFYEYFMRLPTIFFRLPLSSSPLFPPASFIFYHVPGSRRSPILLYFPVYKWRQHQAAEAEKEQLPA
jgi:hypothetical protein